jgi:hypothetical protein
MEIFAPNPWQMSWGERAALEGVLTQRRPKLAIEIGTAQGGSLERIAVHAEEVHSFDLVAPSWNGASKSHVHLHPGDSHVLLKQQLEEFASAGRNVDFVLVDGDHSANGVYRDIQDLLESPAISDTVILIHDASNEEVRRGIERVPYVSFAKVRRVELDWLPGYIASIPERRFEIWGGIGLVIVDGAGAPYDPATVLASQFFAAAPLFEEIRDTLRARESGDLQGPVTSGADDERMAQLAAEISTLRAQVDAHNQIWRDMQESASWRVTAPLRALRRSAIRRWHAR